LSGKSQGNLNSVASVMRRYLEAQSSTNKWAAASQRRRPGQALA
jgi:hypothetical protein